MLPVTAASCPARQTKPLQGNAGIALIVSKLTCPQDRPPNRPA